MQFYRESKCNFVVVSFVISPIHHTTSRSTLNFLTSSNWGPDPVSFVGMAKFKIFSVTVSIEFKA